MSQIKSDLHLAKPQVGSTYTVTLTYYRMQQTPKGPVETEVKDAVVEFYKPRRTSRPHSAFIMKYMRFMRDIRSNEADELAMAELFVKTFCVDDTVREELFGDGCACVTALSSNEMREEFDVFFDKWELTKLTPTESQPLNE